MALLQELGAFDRAGQITDIGRRLARLPVDPRLGRMILAADVEGCVHEVLVLAAALSIPDPRERPSDREEAARQQHARFADEHSDFMSFVNLWRYLQRQRKGLLRQRLPPDVPQRVPALPADPRVAGPTGQLRSIARDIGIRESGTASRPTRRGCTPR